MKVPIYLITGLTLLITLTLIDFYIPSLQHYILCFLAGWSIGDVSEWILKKLN